MKFTLRKTNVPIFILLTVLLTGSSGLFARPISAAETAEATVLKVSGKALIRKAGQTSSLSARRGLLLYRNDRIMTARGARMKIALPDKSVISIAGDTELVLSSLVLKPERNRGSRINLLWGKIKCFVNDITRTSNQAPWQVNTRTAVIGVRGTVFLVWITSRDVVGICAVDKALDVSATGYPTESLVLNPGKFTRVRKDQPPDSPEEVTPELLNKLHQGLFEEDRGLTPGM